MCSEKQKGSLEFHALAKIRGNAFVVYHCTWRKAGRQQARNHMRVLSQRERKIAAVVPDHAQQLESSATQLSLPSFASRIAIVFSGRLPSDSDLKEVCME
jgi:hypothetical protein